MSGPTEFDDSDEGLDEDVTGSDAADLTIVLAFMGVLAALLVAVWLFLKLVEWFVRTSH